MRSKHLLMIMLVVFFAYSTVSLAQENPSNPCNAKSKQAMNPCNPCGSKEMAKMGMKIDPSHAKFGTVFWVADPMKRNSVSFTSEAPLEDIVGTSNEISGYVVFDPSKGLKSGAGMLSIPVASLNSGIPLRDEHLRSADWLNAEKYPEIEFTFDNVTDVKVVKSTATYQTYEARLSGTLSLHGKSKQITVPARFTYMKESKQTESKMPGDLVAGRSAFSIALEDFGVTGPAGMGLIGSKVGKDIAIEVSFVASNAMANAGNPCGDKAEKAMNPCNPCSGKK